MEEHLKTSGHKARVKRVQRLAEQEVMRSQPPEQKMKDHPDYVCDSIEEDDEVSVLEQEPETQAAAADVSMAPADIEDEEEYLYGSQNDDMDQN